MLLGALPYEYVHHLDVSHRVRRPRRRLGDVRVRRDTPRRDG
jgi:hypothetical protein